MGEMITQCQCFFLSENRCQCFFLLKIRCQCFFLFFLRFGLFANLIFSFALLTALNVLCKHVLECVINWKLSFCGHFMKVRLEPTWHWHCWWRLLVASKNCFRYFSRVAQSSRALQTKKVQRFQYQS